MTATDIEALEKANRGLEIVIVEFEDGCRLAVTKIIFDEIPEDAWKSVTRLHERWLAQK